MKIQGVKGVKDILPDQVEKWNYVENAARTIFSGYNYSEIRIPVFEKTELFSRSIGLDTDIVEKEMYSFTDKGGEQITLRPEATASVVRAFVEHQMYAPPGIVKLFCIGPMFRYERPQAGRYRQFYQINAEAFGAAEPEMDAEVVAMLQDFVEQLKIGPVRLYLNSLGCPTCRSPYKEALLKFLTSKKPMLCADCKNRLTKNPLRVLDCKNENCKLVTCKAPQMGDLLCGECRDHFDTTLLLLNEASIKYEVNPRLVRGLDYYTRTTFEMTSDKLGSQDAFVGGGRYDNLIEQIGGPPTPAIGFAIGVERLAALVDFQGARSDALVYLALLGRSASRLALNLTRALKRAHVRVARDFGEKSLKSLLRRADRISADYAVLIGDEEIASGKAIVRDMKKKEQCSVAIADLEKFFAK